MRVLIIGGGVAGVAAATRLRRLDENAEIIIFEKNENFGVASCALPAYFAGEIEDKDDISLNAEYMRRQFNIEVRTNAEVTAINRENQTISVAGSADEDYDKLVFTIGAIQMRPDIPGILGENIFAVRGIESMELIRDYIFYTEVKTALIIGGGQIGMDMAQALQKLKVHPVIVEASGHIMPYMDADMAVLAENRLREEKVELYLNNKVVSLEEKAAVLSNGTRVPYDMVIVATGVDPDLKIPVIADLAIGKDGGLKVNEYMQTNDKNIYAAGDNVEVKHLVTGDYSRISHAGLAIKEAAVAAENIAGQKSKFKGAVKTQSAKIYGFTAGGVGATEDELDRNGISFHKVLLWADSKPGYAPGNAEMLLKLLFGKDGKILGAQGWGEEGVDKRLDIIAAFIQKGGVIEDLINYEICYAPDFANAKDAVNILGSQAQAVLEGRIKQVSYEDILNQRSEFMLVDVRMPEAFEEDHLPEAINIPLNAIRNNLDSFPHDKKVVLYCNRGYGAYTAACILEERGFDNIYILSGSLNLYKEMQKAA